MLGTVFRKWNISGSSWHSKCLNLIPNSNCLSLWFIIAWSWNTLVFLSKKSSIIFRNRELWCFFCQWQMNKISWQICSWAFAFSSIEMLFLTFVACSFLFIKLIIKPVQCCWVMFIRKVWYGVFLVIFINWTWNLFQLFWVCKITFFTEAHCNFLKVVVGWLEWFESRCHSLIHMRYLFIHFWYTRRHVEPLKFSYWINLVSIIPVRHRRIFGWSWRVTALKINGSSWEPGQFSSWLHGPVRLISSLGLHYLLTCHLR